MVVGQKARIDGVVYEFDQKGIARKVLNPNIVPVLAPTTDLSSYVSKSGVRLFPYYLLAYIMPPLYKP